MTTLEQKVEELESQLEGVKRAIARHAQTHGQLRNTIAELRNDLNAARDDITRLKIKADNKQYDTDRKAGVMSYE